jgi:phospho-N-acetylmuramoyl-pentapeptide-transferase
LSVVGLTLSSTGEASLLPLYSPAIILIIGIIYVIESLSVMIQVTSFKLTGKRVFKMSPIHHHFEKCGWSEIKIVSVFSLITALFSALAVILTVI